MKDLDDDDLLIRYLTGKADSEEIRQVENWYSMTDENQKIMEQLYYILQVSNRFKILQSVDHDKALQKLKDKILRIKKRKRYQLVLQRIQSIAAVLCLPVVTLSIWLLLRKNEIPEQVQYVEISSNPGIVASFDLPDGSKAWLNGGSRLRYPVVFNDKIREVQICGEGYFEVVQKNHQPFSVKAGDFFSLEVLGTSFNISAYNDEDIIETTLVEGSVRINMLQNGSIKHHVMKPNEKVIYSKANESGEVTNTIVDALKKQDTDNTIKQEPIKVAKVDPQYEIAWKDQLVMFKNHPMEQVIRTLGRYYNVQFVVKNEKVMESEITGKFSNEQLPQVMEYLMIASGAKFKIYPPVVGDGEMKPGVVEIWK